MSLLRRGVAGPFNRTPASGPYPSPENPNVVHFVDSKNSKRDVKAHIKFCNIVTDAECVQVSRSVDEIDTCKFTNL